MNSEFCGRLSARVMLERAGSGRDATGNTITAWQPRGSFWAALAPAEAPVALAGEGRVSRPRYRIELRGRSDIALGDRLRWSGRRLRILRFEPDPRAPEKLTLLAEEQDA